MKKRSTLSFIWYLMMCALAAGCVIFLGSALGQSTVKPKTEKPKTEVKTEEHPGWTMIFKSESMELFMQNKITGIRNSDVTMRIARSITTFTPPRDLDDKKIKATFKTVGYDCEHRDLFILEAAIMTSDDAITMVRTPNKVKHVEENEQSQAALELEIICGLSESNVQFEKRDDRNVI